MKVSFVRPLGTIPQTPAPVAGVVATVVSSTEIDLSWIAVSGAQNYTVRIFGNPVLTLPVTSANFTGLTPSTTYNFTVAAINSFGEGLPSQIAVATTQPAPVTGSIKFHPGFYMGSNNVNGTGASNGSEFTILAASGPKVLGWFGIYQWRQFENATAGVYDFSALAADFNALQTKKPGSRFGGQIWAEAFSGTTVSFGIPQYILTNSIYGPGQDGIHFGYWTGVNGGGFAAIWRPSVNDRYAAMFEALAGTSFLTTAGPYAGQTFTWDTHPLVEAFFDQETSLPVTAGSDYSESTYATQCSARYTRMGAAFKHTNFGSLINDMSGSPPSVGVAVTGAFNGRCAMAWPDTQGASTGTVTWGQHFYRGDQWNGTTFVPGGTDRRGHMACLGWVESPDYSRWTAQDMFNGMVPLQVTHAVFTLVQGGVANSNWTSAVLPVINGNTIPSAVCPTNYAGACFFG